MTSTQPRLTPEDQHAVLVSVTSLLIHSLPGDWNQLFFDFRAMGRYVETPVTVLNIFGQSVDWTLPDEALPFFLELRAGMYREGQGTWTSVKYHLAHPNVYSIEYDWDEEPEWTHRPPERFFLEELEMFPRTEENIAGWLRERAGLPAPAGPTEQLYEAPVFDRFDEHGKPVPLRLGVGDRPIFDRPKVHQQERDDVLAYLQNAPIVLAARGYSPDLIKADAEPGVPMTFHTDGTWVWSGAVHYYYLHHHVDPVPQLVQHIRENDYKVPPVTDAAQAAATKVATGQAASLPLPEYEPRVIAEHDRRALERLKVLLDKYHVMPHEYGIVEPVMDALVIEPAPGSKDGWQVQFWDANRGPTGRPTVFSNAANAARTLLASLLWDDSNDAARERYWAAQAKAPEPSPPTAPVPTAAAVAPVDIQPAPDEPPLSLFRDREVVTLPEGTEIDRFGDESGNLVYAARTMYGNRSLPPDWLNRRYHIYRVRKPITAVKGVAVPWFGQVGGGTGYFLERLVRDLLEDGSLVEIAEASTAPPAPQI